MSGLHSPGDTVNDRYEIVNYIGEGGMQFVYAAKDSVLDRLVALKTPKNSSAEKRFKRSAVVAAKVNHPNIAKTLDYVKVGEHRYLIEELIEGKDLESALLAKAEYVDPYMGAKVFHYLAKGVAAAHRVGVIHRDLKPTNIMVIGELSLDALKITDFGIAKMADEELAEAAEGGTSTISTSSTAVGALPYMAPEAIDTPRDVGTAADIWSIGAMMFHLLTGNPPYGSGLRAVGKILEAAPPVFPEFMTSNPHFSPLASKISALILKCLNKDPTKRPSADELVTECGSFCYPIAGRYTGVVRSIRYNAWGFIDHSDGDVFFHLSSVYGRKPETGEAVSFSRYEGGGAPRAHPIVLLKTD